MIMGTSENSAKELEITDHFSTKSTNALTFATVVTFKIVVVGTKDISVISDQTMTASSEISVHPELKNMSVLLFKRTLPKLTIFLDVGNPVPNRTAK